MTHFLRPFRLTAAATSAAVLLAASAAQAQTPNNISWGNTGVGDWNVGSNWPQFGAVPQADLFNEQAVIDNGGTAFVAGAVPAVGAITLGATAATTGSVEVRAGGALTVVANGVTTGLVQVGAGAVAGTLGVNRGGSLTSPRLSTAAGVGTVDLGGGVGPGAGTLNITEASILRAVTRLRRDASFTTAQLEMGGQSNLTTEVTSTGNAMVNVTGLARLNGTLTLEFLGVSPTAASTWSVLDAAGIAGTFGTITSPTALGPGLRFAQQVVPNGAGQRLQVDVEEVITLMVNRSTGAATIVSESGTPVTISGYNLQSASGRILTSYNSLSDQGLGGFQESGPAGFTATQSGELSATGGFAITSTGVSLGAAIGPAVIPAFGTAINDDVTLNFTRADGRNFAAFVTFDTAPIANTLVLTIDPATGNAQLKNDSPTNLSFDAYSIGSTSGALRTTWNSLADQALTGWQEANPSVNRVSELKPSGGLALAAGGTLALNGLWNTAGVQNVADLSLNFNDDTLGEFTGVVRFGSLVVALPGDANGDGFVNLLDLDILGANFGLTTGATLSQGDFNADGAVNLLDLDILGANFGAGGPAVATAVPEPTGLFAALVALLAGVFSRRRYRHLQPLECAMVAGKAARRMTPALAVLLTAAAAEAQLVSITGANTATLASAFTDGSITITPLDVNGSPTGFGPSTVYIGPLGNGNDNAINDVDGRPSTTGDRDGMTIALASGKALQEIRWGFTRANPVLLSGFGADPLARVASSPGGAALSYNSATGTLAIFDPSFSATETVIAFGNAAATDGRTLSASLLDYFQAGPQLAFTRFTYNSSSAFLAAGDVDGLNGVTVDDFNVIRSNFFGTAPLTRSRGDLSGDGNVTLTDFALWETNFTGNSAGFAELLVGVPEPSSAVMLLAGLAGFSRRRRV